MQTNTTEPGTLPDLPDAAALAARVSETDARADALTDKLAALRTRHATARRAADAAERAFVDGDPAGDDFARLDAEARALDAAAARTADELAAAETEHAEAVATVERQDALDAMAAAALDAGRARAALESQMERLGETLAAEVAAVLTRSGDYQAAAARFHAAGIAAELPEPESAGRLVSHRSEDGALSDRVERSPFVDAVLADVRARLASTHPSEADEALAAAYAGHRLSPAGELRAFAIDRPLWGTSPAPNPFRALEDERGQLAAFGPAIAQLLRNALSTPAPSFSPAATPAADVPAW